MNAEKFAFYIKNPAHLYQITYTELKSLVLQYPYCQNLRYLLLKKSILDNHPEREQNLQLAATFSPDRNFLYTQIKEGDSYLSEADSFLLKEEYLELKELNPSAETEMPNLNLQEGSPEISSPPIMETIDGVIELTNDTIAEDTSPEEETLVPPLVSEVNEMTEQTDPEQEASNYIDDEFEEEDFEDITDEMEEDFEEGLADLEIAPLIQEEAEEDIQTPEPSEEPESEEDPEPKGEAVEDEAISIEDLIKLDSLSPLERLEKNKAREKTKKKHTKEKNEEQLEVMKKKAFDFDDIGALIEKTKKDLPLEITNKDDLALKEDSKVYSSPKSSFGSWLKQFKTAEEEEREKEEFELFDIPDDDREDEVKKKKKSKKKAKKKKKQKLKKSEKKKVKANRANDSEEKNEKPKSVAEKSLQENTELVSETLANLLVKQENYKKAIKMYEKLSLIFPEKSGFFAEQIKKLKKL